MNNVEEAIGIARKYKQCDTFENYVKGFSVYWDNVYKLLPPSDKTLDIGCAYGILALSLSLRGDKVTAADMTSRYTSLKMLKENDINFITLDIEKSDIKDSYELITLTETIEHLNANPLKPLQRIFEALEDKGHVFISTVAREIHGDTTRINSGVAGLYNDLDNWHDIPTKRAGKWLDQHTFHYDQFNLVDLVTEAGFEVSELGMLGSFSHYIIGTKRC